MLLIHISSDRLQAFLTWEGALDLAQISAELQTEGVKYGMDEATIHATLQEGADQGSVCIATGLKPITREPARVQLNIKQNQTSGAFDEDTQRMDFRERGGVHSVQLGDAIGTWFPGTDGTPGKGVDGMVINPPAPATSDQSRGQNVHAKAGENGSLNLFAEIDGVVRVGPSGDVYVTDLFEVESDVDLGCGNIDVSGSVHIHGTIRSGFRVHAGQDIDVDEAIEHANVTAGKSLGVGSGILASNDNLIQAEEQIRAKFTQNAILRSGGDVILEVDTNSTIEAARSILAKEGSGHLRGGNYVAGESLIVKELGSTQGVETRVRLGMEPQQLRELAKLQKDIKAAQAQAKKLERQRGVQSARRVGRSMTREQAGGIRRAMKAQRDLRKVTDLLEQKQRDFKTSTFKDGLPVLRVEKTIHSGVNIQMGSAHLFIDHTRPGGTFHLDPNTGEITSS
ncbi:MAG: DUF342 domain-containing protein [bacterium]|nr:DUF342 domain-containing protein [bacterium]